MFIVKQLHFRAYCINYTELITTMQVGVKAYKIALCLNESTLFPYAKRCTGTFTSITGKSLWESTSPESRRTGRGKRARIRRKEDFSGSHKMGEGQAGIDVNNLHIILSFS